MLKWEFFDRYRRDPARAPLNDKEPISLQCPICSTHTDAIIVGHFATPPSKFIQLPNEDMQVYNYLVRCTRCRGGILVMYPYGEGYSHSGLGGYEKQALVADWRVYPFPTSAFESEELASRTVPEAVYEDFRQAELAFYAGAPYGAGLLIRRACQNICRHQGISDTKNLKAEIKQLQTIKGVITEHLADMAHNLRIIGNELAHPNPQTPFVITNSDIRDAREFLKQLIEVIYLGPARAQAQKANLKKRGVTGT